jgi:uncharacterized protein
MTEKDFYKIIAEELNLKSFQVANTIELLDKNNTVPFIARYRKESTGKLDEDQIRSIEERIKYLRMLEERKKTILKSIEEQGKLSVELADKIKSSLKLQEVEDLYLPYKPKKRTRATIAKEQGLEPLAQLILQQNIFEGNPHQYARDFVEAKKNVNNTEQALNGAKDIIAEIISDDAEVRKRIRQLTSNLGILHCQAKDPDKPSEYEIYYDFKESVKHLVPHRILAINRGEREKYIRVQLKVELEFPLNTIGKQVIKNRRSIFLSIIEETIEDSYKRLIAPSIEREIRTELTENAEKHAIKVFARNLKNLLLQPPVKDKIIMGIDPGYRTGCKIAVIDETGKYLESGTIYPHPPQNEIFESKELLRKLIEKYNVEIIAIGNGTASRETEVLVAELISEIEKENNKKLYYIIVSEAGASVYSTSQIGKQEFPDLDPSLRGNISIARRLQDPLAELVKIEPKSIGVGLYQHDVNQKKLNDSLNVIVESAVNLVGVDLNTASFSLLKYISGLTAKTAENVVKYRNEHGRFNNREELHKVKGLGGIAYQQAAGFLRIPESNNLLDNTSIHPESYSATQKLLNKFQIVDKPVDWKSLPKKLNQDRIDLKKLANEINIGEPTLEDILSNLEKPGRDPREELPKPILKSDVLKLEDLHEGMILKGTVRNVVDFGAFVDIGIKRDGLVHVSEMGKKFVKNPHKIVSVGDIISVKVIGIDIEKGRVKLSLRI